MESGPKLSRDPEAISHRFGNVNDESVSLMLHSVSAIIVGRQLVVHPCVLD